MAVWLPSGRSLCLTEGLGAKINQNDFLYVLNEVPFLWLRISIANLALHDIHMCLQSCQQAYGCSTVLADFFALLGGPLFPLFYLSHALFSAYASGRD